MKTDILVTVLSWEERYILGLEQNLKEYKPSQVIVFNYSAYSDWKKDNLKKTKELLGDSFIEVPLDILDIITNWYMFKETFAKHCIAKNVLVDISTMTRESIWQSFFNCKKNGCDTKYIYYKPQGYSNDWISRDPGKPRFLYKMSGISKLGAPTLLMVTGGYDIQRLDSLIHNFEPIETILFFQSGNDYRNKENYKDSQFLLHSKYNIEQLFEYDAYDVNGSFNLVSNKLHQKDNKNSKSNLENYNIILNSLGSKISAVTLFNIWLKFPQVALSYIPSKEYNREYSFGIGNYYTGQIKF